jgi:hypothetical protein
MGLGSGEGGERERGEERGRERRREKRREKGERRSGEFSMKQLAPLLVSLW